MTVDRIATSLGLAPLPVATSAVARHGRSDAAADRKPTLQRDIDASRVENPHATIGLLADGHRDDVVLAPVSRMMARDASRAAVAVGRVTAVGDPGRTNADEVRRERIPFVDGPNERTGELR